MKNILIITICLIAFQSYAQNKAKEPKTISVEWVEHLKGDYKFKNKWSYPEGVMKNQFGQLSCDGLCPEGTEQMKDNRGKIFKDSLSAFYKLVDTTHQFHSLRCEARCDEFGGADYIEVRKYGDTVIAWSMCDAATHCSLHLKIINSQCVATIKLNSITGAAHAAHAVHTYPATKGSIKIDKQKWTKGVMKAEFNFNFDNEGKTSPVFWKGKIYCKMQ